MDTSTLATLVAAALVLAARPAAAQLPRRADSTTARADSALTDSARVTRARHPESIARRTADAGAATARVTERIIFTADEDVERLTRHRDPLNATLRALSPVAFWTPIAVTVAEPIVWGDALYAHRRDAAVYAGSATAALALGFIVSRTTKAFVHRARPCTGRGPTAISLRPVDADAPRCAATPGIGSYTSFFSEHTMAMFAMAGATAFEAERLGDRNANLLTAAAFSSAAAVGVGRIYEQHHWLSDVLVGAGVGTAAAFATSRLPLRIWRR